MTEPASHTIAYLRRLDEKLDRPHSEVGRGFEGSRAALTGWRAGSAEIEDELLVLNAIALRLQGTGLKAIFDRHERGLAAPPQ